MLVNRDGVKDVCETPGMSAGNQVLVPLSAISHRSIFLAPVIQFLMKEKRRGGNPDLFVFSIVRQKRHLYGL